MGVGMIPLGAFLESLDYSGIFAADERHAITDTLLLVDGMVVEDIHSEQDEKRKNRNAKKG